MTITQGKALFRHQESEVRVRPRSVYRHKLKYYQKNAFLPGIGEKKAPLEHPGKRYLSAIASRHSAVALNDRVLGGMPTLKGRRIDVALIVACLKEGMTIQDICVQYQLQEAQVRSVLDFVIDVLDQPFVDAEAENEKNAF